MKTSGFEARINKIAANGPTVLTERTDAVLIGPVRIPFQVCGTFEVHDDRIVLWRDTFDWTSGLVNTLIAGPLYALPPGLDDHRPQGRSPERLTPVVWCLHG